MNGFQKLEKRIQDLERQLETFASLNRAYLKRLEGLESLIELGRKAFEDPQSPEARSARVFFEAFIPPHPDTFETQIGIVPDKEDPS